MAQMKRMVVVGFGVVVALSTARCFDPHYPERLPCDRVDDCPPGQACYAGTCGRALESACDQPEVCNAVDDDCDGEIDETGPDDAGVCTCVVGTIQPCGRCGDGLQSCTAAGLWGACAGATPAGACCPGQTRSCGISTGECRTGLESCTGNGAWSGVCAGGVDPVAERCNGRDDDCDGAADEGCPACISFGSMSLYPLGNPLSGDRDFKGHGPRVTISTRYRRNGTQVCANVTVDMIETASDWSHATRTIDRCVDAGGTVASVMTPDTNHVYTDVDQNDVDIVPAQVGSGLTSISCTGDTNGDDICGDQPMPNCSGCQIVSVCPRVTYQ